MARVFRDLSLGCTWLFFGGCDGVAASAAAVADVVTLACVPFVCGLGSGSTSLECRVFFAYVNLSGL